MLGNGQAQQYSIGVGRIGFTWSGEPRVSAKREWPSWTPPADMRRRRPDLPRSRPADPLGARALYLGSTLYRIHASNEPETIGQAASSGCFRMRNEDVIHLYNRVPVGATVIVQQWGNSLHQKDESPKQMPRLIVYKARYGARTVRRLVSRR
jgi:lipoprotein-anchoring transpeptidase ErfK/SrfK